MKATALEVLSEPLTLLISLTALVLTVLAPTFHYHQFGEATRMARDSGLSALFVGLLVLVTFGAIKTFRREAESGTREMALAHPLSRVNFFLSKTLGVAIAALVFALIVFSSSITIFCGAAEGGKIALRTGELPCVWGPCVAAGVATLIVPLLIGAMFNRLWRFRFVLTTIMTSLMLSLAAALWFSFALTTDAFVRLTPPAILLVIFALPSLSAAAAFAVRFATNIAAALTTLTVAGAMIFAGNYYLADSLAKGGSVPWTYVGLAVLAIMPAIAAFLILGCRLSRED